MGLIPLPIKFPREENKVQEIWTKYLWDISYQILNFLGAGVDFESVVKVRTEWLGKGERSHGVTDLSVKESLQTDSGFYPAS